MRRVKRTFLLALQAMSVRNHRAMVGAVLAGLLLAAGTYLFYFRVFYFRLGEGVAEKQAKNGVSHPSQKGGKSLRVAGADAGYVDSAACAPCHTKIYETYQHTGMARSFFRPRRGLRRFSRLRALSR